MDYTCIVKYQLILFLLGPIVVFAGSTGQIHQDKYFNNVNMEVKQHDQSKLNANRIQKKVNIESNSVKSNHARSTTIHEELLLPQYNGFRISFYATNQKVAIEFEEQLEITFSLREKKQFQRIYRGTKSNLNEGFYVVDFIPVDKIAVYKRTELDMVTNGNSL